ncbi:dimethylarginine dimethylaminohydrolase family protein [Phenylobacterium sp.]|jgi:N-dimethylarginine dimethylaminohydrolase|uniref:dimethylarginine dimethylaminohydrolase family protein n=1 Tax=Phenylobacterium sp. TaxID=1871053 RepID=UPI002E36A319|nr:arginine deiminase-related protein [Phenylobacterium sp.]HEX3364697.1 arginine deiminase-related protein [Phenylobacterium sp.]
MTAPARFLMTDPAAFDVSYRINPWMDPGAWTAEHRAAALAASGELRAALQALGAHVETIEAVRGLPDLVFPANAAVVLDGRVLLARFRHPERQGEETVFRAVFARLKARGVVSEVIDLPDGVLQEGAGDAIWDAGRGWFWAGFGPRSNRASLGVIRKVFGREVVGLELASERFYHLDTCFCPLVGGEVLYHPDAFTPDALATIRARIAEADRIEATAEEAAAFCVNAVNLGQTLVMARAPATLRAKLEARGYRLVEIDLAPFIRSGGAAYCMTLRLDRTSDPRPAILAAE